MVSRPEGEYRWKHIAQAAERERDILMLGMSDAFRALCSGDSENERVKQAIKIVSDAMLAAREAK